MLIGFISNVSYNTLTNFGFAQWAQGLWGTEAEAYLIDRPMRTDGRGLMLAV